MRHVSDAEVAAVFPLVSRILRTMRVQNQLSAAVDAEDLEAVGRAAAWRALTRIESGRDQREVDAFLWAKITGGILDYQRTATRAVGHHRRLGRLTHIAHLEDRVPSADPDSFVTIGDTLVDPADIAHTAEVHERLERARRVADGLRGRKRVVADWILDGEPGTARALAGHLGVTESRISQLGSEVRHLFDHAPLTGARNAA